MSTITWQSRRSVIINTTDKDKAEYLVQECNRINSDPFTAPLEVRHDFDRVTGRHRVIIREAKQ